MSKMNQQKSYVLAKSLVKVKQNNLCPRWIHVNFMSMMDQQKLCIGGNSIFWQKENKIPFVHDGSTEIISRSEAKYFMFMMYQR